MKIAACYIVRNEGRNLRASLESLRKSVDAIVVVDTGSTDDTKEIAGAYGAELYDFPWQGDFSAARNFALDKVRADWVVSPDGDEYFSGKTAGNLRRVIEREAAAGKEVLLVPWHNIDGETGEVLLDSFAPRIFRLRPEFRYEGRIHEELRAQGKPIERVGVLSPEELTLVHTGYSARLSKEKAARNVELLLRELGESAEPGNLYMYLAEAYDGLEDEENALKYARLDIALGRRNIVYASRSWRILLRRLADDARTREERREIAAQAAREFPELPEFHAEYAESLALLLDFPGAVREAAAAERVFAEYAAHSGIEPMMFDERMLETLGQRKSLWENIAARLPGMKVTSCLIVRDGEADMECWLRNTERFSDERIVVDTGSADRSRELAAAAGCEVRDFAWQGDFSRAKNAALDGASGGWISFLDVDEAFEEPGQVKPFLAWLEVCHPEKDAVMVPLRNVDEDDGGREISRSAVVRLFRNHRGLRYEGNVHEELRRRDGSLPDTFREGQRLWLRHWGYSSGRIEAKTRRNLALLQEDIALHGESARHYRYLADCYATLGEWEEALAYAKKAAEAPLQPSLPDSKMQHLMLVAMRNLDRSFSEQEGFAREMCGAFSGLPEFHAILGVLLAEQGKEDEAYSSLRRAMELAGSVEAAGLPSDFADDAGLACAWLAFLCDRKGRAEEREDFLARALSLAPREDEVLNLARKLRGELSPKDFRAWLAAWLPFSGETELWLVRWAERNGQADLFAGWCEDARKASGKRLPRAAFLTEEAWTEPENFMKRLLGGMAEDIRQLVAVLLELEREQMPQWRVISRQCRELLPRAMEETWLAYEGKREDFPADGFRALWPMVRDGGEDAQLARFARLALGLEGDVWRGVAGELMAHEKWSAALSLYGEIPADSPRTDGAFWHDAGVCLWHTGDRAAAAECFGRARGMGATEKDMDAYETWGEEERP